MLRGWKTIALIVGREIGNVSERTIKRWHNKNPMPVKWINKSPVIEVSQLVLWIKTIPKETNRS